jgi:GNAT superfamily N-acetyltransferase
MQQIRTLGDVSLTTLAAAVGQAFEDYIVKIDASPAALGARWYGARVDYALSFGAFENDQLVAFLLHGIDDSKNGKTAHNVVCGVVPTHRGKRLIEQIYEKALPVLRHSGVKTLTLEVITENEKAIKAYQNVGLRPAGMLRCFDGTLNVPDEKAFASFRVQKIQDYEWDLVKDLVSYTYSWDNQPDAVAMLADDYETWLVYDMVLPSSILKMALSHNLASVREQPIRLKCIYSRLCRTFTKISASIIFRTMRKI